MPMVNNTMMQVTSLVLNGMACRSADAKAHVADAAGRRSSACSAGQPTADGYPDSSRDRLVLRRTNHVADATLRFDKRSHLVLLAVLILHRKSVDLLAQI